MRTLFKVVIALVAVGVVAVLFVRSAQSTRSEPFTIARQDLTGWTLTLTPDGDSVGSLLSLTPKETVLPPLSRALFARMGESLRYPQATMAIVLRWVPACDGRCPRAGGAVDYRAGRRTRVRDAPARMHGPSPHQFTRNLRGVFFVVFEMPVFSQFREQVAQQLHCRRP
jgi:hypothetical protein